MTVSKLGGAATEDLPAEPAASPTPTRPAASPTPTSSPSPSALPSSDDWSVEVDDSECVHAGGSNPFSLEARLPGLEGRLVDWVVRKDGAEVTRETITVQFDEDMGDAYHELSIGMATAGRYESTLTLADDHRPLLTTSFRLLDCVRTELSCHTVRFINSPANPAVKVKYQPSQDVDDLEADKDLRPRKGVRDRGIIRLGPGEAVNLTTYRRYLLWDARGPKNSDGRRSNAGEGYAHVIPQRC